MPRVKRFSGVDIVREEADGDPEELREVIRQESRVLVQIPLNYPEASLPWIVARELLGEESNRKILPIVIDAKNIRPPKGDFEAIVPLRLVERARSIVDAELIFIIYDVNLHSATKLDFLLDQIDKNENAKFIFIARNEIDLILKSDFIINTRVLICKLCAVSFAEIAHFVRKNFEMSGEEAEVVALRLNRTFSQFHLDAHPTYFAGIPKDVLWKILEANRRTELIGLAVDGFLTFVVADDTSQISLSKSTRARFLRRLAFEINVNGRRLDEFGIIEFVTKFADGHDFDIQPIAFIHGFVENGILYKDDGVYCFALQFIEWYLLASELREDDVASLQYFTTETDDFDFATFNIYAELGPSEKVIQKILNVMNKRVVSLQSDALQTTKRQPAILSGALVPKIMKSETRLRAIQARISSLSSDVKAGKRSTEEKQKLLDIVDKAQLKAAQKTIKSRSKQKTKTPSLNGEFQQDCLNWSIAVNLIGAGAEYLSADIKRQLVRSIIVVGDHIIDHALLAMENVDFDQIKKSIINDEAVQELALQSGLDASGAVLQDMKKFLDGFLDLTEMHMLSLPFRGVVGYICDRAQNPVLASSIMKVPVTGPVEKILHSLWLCDLSPKEGFDQLSENVKDLPPSIFFRSNVATHLLSRAFWSHWKPQDRLYLLDAAQEILKAENRQLIVGAEEKRKLNLKLESPKQRLRRRRARK